MQLTNGQTYTLQGQKLYASFLLGTWVLMRLDYVQMGDIAAYRFLQGEWRECRFAPGLQGDEIYYGSTVEIDLASLILDEGDCIDDGHDEQFCELMAELAWEWG